MQTELFSMIGWFPEVFSTETHHIRPDLALAASFAGNAFSAYHLGPVLLAACAAHASPASKFPEFCDACPSESSISVFPEEDD